MLHRRGRPVSWLVSSFFGPEAAKRGEESEERVFKVIQEMLVWKELPIHKKGVHPYRTEKWSELDMEGIDIVVPSKRGDIYIQVKSSSFSVLNFIWNKKKAKRIICINGQRSELVILQELRKRLAAEYRYLGSQM